jgi:hypothetical protein
MKAAQMAECLQKIAPLLDHSEAAKLLQLSAVVKAEGDKNFGPYCAKVEKGLASGHLAPLDSAAAQMMRLMGPQSNDFIAAGRLLKALGSVGAAEMPAEVAKALVPPTRKAARSSKPAAIEPRSAADELTALSQDVARFDALLSEVTKLPKAKLAEVAALYLGFRRGYKSKDDIAKAIRARRLQDVIDESRESRGSKIGI